MTTRIRPFVVTSWLIVVELKLFMYFKDYQNYVLYGDHQLGFTIIILIQISPSYL
jgi:hypothetical protein